MELNLNNQPTVDELAELFAKQRDTLDDHVLWVCEEGGIHIDRLAPNTDETELERVHPRMRARLRTYRRGKGYVGKKAAADREFMGRVLRTLQSEWPEAQKQAEVRILDRYC